MRCIKIIIRTLKFFFSAVLNVQVHFKTWTMTILLFVFLIKCKMSNNELLVCFYFWNYRYVGKCLKFLLENKRLGERVLREGCIVGDSGSRKVSRDTG